MRVSKHLRHYVVNLTQLELDILRDMVGDDIVAMFDAKQRYGGRLSLRLGERAMAVIRERFDRRVEWAKTAYPHGSGKWRIVNMAWNPVRQRPLQVIKRLGEGAELANGERRTPAKGRRRRAAAEPVEG